MRLLIWGQPDHTPEEGEAVLNAADVCTRAAKHRAANHLVWRRARTFSAFAEWVFWRQQPVPRGRETQEESKDCHISGPSARLHTACLRFFTLRSLIKPASKWFYTVSRCFTDTHAGSLCFIYIFTSTWYSLWKFSCETSYREAMFCNVIKAFVVRFGFQLMFPLQMQFIVGKIKICDLSQLWDLLWDQSYLIALATLMF